MSKKNGGFSLVIVVIFMSIAALFVGYLMGSWLISFLVDEDQAEMAQNTNQTTQSKEMLQENNQQKTKNVNNSSNNLTAPLAKEKKAEKTADDKEKQIYNKSSEKKAAVEKTKNNGTDLTKTLNDSSNNSAGENLKKGDFGVQIGAFSNYSNALQVKEKVEKMSYQVIVTEGSPHQVQVIGYSDRSQAEIAAAELEKEGYPGFIVTRE